MSRRHMIAVGILAIGVGFTGCSTTDTAAQKRSLYVDAHPELTELMANAILAEQIQIGMSSDMVEVAWGKPSRVEKANKEGMGDKWVYGNFFVGRTITNLFFDPDHMLVRYEVQDQATTAAGASPDSPSTTVEGASTPPSELTKGPGGNPPR